MTDSSQKSGRSLDKLRAEIDRLDSVIHAALRDRMGIVEELAGAKGPAGSMRPAREMEVLRALVEAHDGAMPVAQVIRIWREIMAASLAYQSPFDVHLYSAGDDIAFWDLARFHFGSATPLHAQKSFGHVLTEVNNGNGTVGVLPEPEFEESNAWWPHLLFAADDGPRVIAKLPLFEGAAGYDFPSAMVIGNVTQRPTGDDASLVVVLAATTLRRTKVADQVAAVGIKANLLSMAADESDDANRYLLFETTEYVAEDDPRLLALPENGEGIGRAKIVGGYAQTIQLTEGA